VEPLPGVHRILGASQPHLKCAQAEPGVDIAGIQFGGLHKLGEGTPSPTGLDQADGQISMERGQARVPPQTFLVQANRFPVAALASYGQPVDVQPSCVPQRDPARGEQHFLRCGEFTLFYQVNDGGEALFVVP
jgi:hypothetical protein